MWYFAWILGTLLACSFGIMTALALEHVEENAKKEQQ
ncbi:cytochrome bd-I oxidase subunit CydX [Erwinia sp. V71]